MIRRTVSVSDPAWTPAIGKPYRWRGIPGWDPAKATAAPAPPAAPVPDKRIRPLPAHGTLAAVSRHKRRHESLCEPCRLVSSAQRKKLRVAAARKAATS